MKRLCKFTLAILFLLILASCGQQPVREPSAEKEIEQVESVETEDLADENSADENHTQIQEADSTMKDRTFDFETITGSSNPDHIKENTELFDFELTEEEMEQIHALDRGEKHDWY